MSNWFSLYAVVFVEWIAALGAELGWMRRVGRLPAALVALVDRSA